MGVAPRRGGSAISAWALSGSAAWPEVATQLGRVLAARIVGLFSDNLASQPAGGEILASVGLDSPATDTYRQFAPGNPWFMALRRQPGCAIVTGADLVPAFELVRTRFYRGWLRPLNVRHALIGTVARDPQSAVFLIALREPSQPPFDGADAELLRLTVPALAAVATLATELAATRDLVDDFVTVLGMCPEAVLVIDGELRPLYLNQPARVLLSEGDGLAFRQGALTVASRDDMASLKRFVAEAIDPDRENGSAAAAPAASLLIGRRSGRPPLALQIAGLPRPVVDANGRPAPAAAVLVRQPKGPEALGVFRQHYGMTPREARLASLIAAGRSLLDAAFEMGITRNTARTHMKRVYAKTDTQRQVDLVRLLDCGVGGAL